MQSKDKNIFGYFNNNKDNMDNLIRTTAGLSFLVGTLIFLLYSLFLSKKLIGIGYCFVLLSILINLALLLFTLVLILNKYLQKENTKEHWTSLLTLLANIPIAIIYFLIVMAIEY